MTIFEEITRALSEREAEYQAALEIGFDVEDRLERIRYLLRRSQVRDSCATALSIRFKRNKI